MVKGKRDVDGMEFLTYHWIEFFNRLPKYVVNHWIHIWKANYHPLNLTIIVLRDIVH